MPNKINQDPLDILDTSEYLRGGSKTVTDPLDELSVDSYLREPESPIMEFQRDVRAHKRVAEDQERNYTGLNPNPIDEFYYRQHQYMQRYPGPPVSPEFQEKKEAERRQIERAVREALKDNPIFQNTPGMSAIPRSLKPAAAEFSAGVASGATFGLAGDKERWAERLGYTPSVAFNVGEFTGDAAAVAGIAALTGGSGAAFLRATGLSASTVAKAISGTPLLERAFVAAVDVGTAGAIYETLKERENLTPEKALKGAAVWALFGGATPIAGAGAKAGWQRFRKFMSKIKDSKFRKKVANAIQRSLKGVDSAEDRKLLDDIYNTIETTAGESGLSPMQARRKVAAELGPEPRVGARIEPKTPPVEPYREPSPVIKGHQGPPAPEKWQPYTEGAMPPEVTVPTEEAVHYFGAGVSLSKVRESVKGLVDKAGRLTPNALRQMKNRFTSENGKSFVDKMLNEVRPSEAGLEGQAWGKFKKAGLTRKDAKMARSGELADKLMNDDPSVAKYRRIWDWMYDTAAREGVDVAAYRTGYVHNMLKRKVSEVLLDDLSKFEKTSKLMERVKAGENVDDVNELIKKSMGKKGFNKSTRQAIQHAMDTGQADSYVDAYLGVMERAVDDTYRPFGALTKSRRFELPESFYDRNMQRVTAKYVHSWAQEVARQKAFGNKNVILKDMFKGMPADEERTARLIYDIWDGKYAQDRRLPAAVDMAIDMSQGGLLITKIAWGWGALKNVFQTIYSTATEAGVGRTLKGIAKLFDPQMQARLEEAGVKNQVIRSGLQGLAGDGPSGMVGEVTRKALIGFGFTPMNALNLDIAGSTAQGFILDLYKTANGKMSIGNKIFRTFGGDPQKRAAAILKSRFGINASENLTKEKMMRGMYRFATETQLQEILLTDPIVSHHPLLRPLLLFKRFGIKQALYIKDRVIKEELLEHGNVAPAVRLLVGGSAAGYAVTNTIEGIKSTLTGRDVGDVDRKLSPKSVPELVAGAGAMGVVSDMVADEDKVRQLIWQVVPVQGRVIYNMIDGMVKVAKEVGDYGVWNTVRRTIPRVMSGMGSIPAAIGRGLKTDRQVRDEAKAYKTSFRDKYCEALYKEDFDEAIRLKKTFYKRYPDESYLAPGEESDGDMVAAWLDRKLERKMNP